MCRYSQICQNTIGGYGCLCPRGYRSQGIGLPCLGRTLLHLLQIRHKYEYNCIIDSVVSMQTSMNASRHQVRAPLSAVMCLAASGACVHLELCCLGMDARVQGWREDSSSRMEPESERDFGRSWCHPSGGRFCLVLTGYLVLPGRVAL